MHLVSKAIRDGECSMALVAGVSQILQPNLSINFAKAGMLSRDGYCHSFDASANGHVRGEGVDAVVLKSLEEAQRDGDNILAVLNGSAINQDGRSSDLTVPNGPSQKKVIRDALMDGSLIPADTGAPLGDSIEIKSNIGHLEGAAGIAGLIKTILAVQTAHSGHVWFLEAQQLDRFQGFERHGQLRCHQLAQRPFQKVAGVSSFGFGGTNAHVVVSEAPPSESPFVEAFAPNEGNVLVVTATPGKALEQLAQRYADFIEANPEVSVGRLCYAVNTGRAALAQRAVFYGHDNQPDVLVKNVRAYASAPEYSAMAVGKASDVSSNVAMIFPSTLDASTMSCQYLFNTQPAFRHAIEKCGVSEQLFGGNRRRSVSFADSAVDFLGCEADHPIG